MRRRFALNKADIIKVFTDDAFEIISTESTATSTPILYKTIYDIPNLGQRESGRKYGNYAYILRPIHSQMHPKQLTLEVEE